VTDVSRTKYGNYFSGLYGKRKNYTHKGILESAQKLRLLTIQKEWEALWEKRPEKIAPLHQLCIDQNLGYLYDELIKSKTVDQFKETMMLINKMLL